MYRWLYTTSHKDIGLLYLILAFVGGFLGTALLETFVVYTNNLNFLVLCSLLFYCYLGYVLTLCTCSQYNHNKNPVRLPNLKLNNASRANYSTKSSPHIKMYATAPFRLYLRVALHPMLPYIISSL